MIINKSTFEFFPRRIRHLFNFDLRSDVSGKVLTVPLRSGSGLDSHWNRSWKTEVIKQLLSGESGAFIDIGANLGQTLIDHYVADTQTQYIGFEPNPICAYYLNELTRINGLSNHVIMPIGLAEKAQIASFFYRTDTPDDDSATLIEDLRPTWNLSKRYIPCYDFDQVSATLELTDISLIKIDVEGAELQVLKGMSNTIQNFRPIMLCEVLYADAAADASFNERRNSEMIQLFNELNYNVLQLIKTADDQKVTEAKKIEQFSNAVFSAETRPLCDYLFVPTEKTEQVLNRILPSKNS